MTVQIVNKQSKRRLFAWSGFVIRVLLIIGALSLALLSSACDSEDIPGLAQAPAKATLPLPPAAPYDAGPQAWLEYPLEGQTMPLEEPVPFVVYATDAKGVAQVELRVNGQPLPAAQVEGLSPDGSNRLVRLDQEWPPPAEGEYIAEARGRNTAGGYGEPAYAKFCVGSCRVSTPTPAPMDTPTPAPVDTSTPAPMDKPTPHSTDTPTPTPTPRFTATPTATSLPPTPTATFTPPPPPPGVTIQFWSDAPYVNAGQCTMLRWNVEGVREVYLNGSPVAGGGSQQICLCQATTYTLHVVKVDGSTEDRQVFIDVYGSCETPEPPPPPPPPQDATGPDIGWVGLAWEDCQFYGQATISDPSGVNWAQFYYSMNGEGPYSVWMGDIGGGLWQTKVPISASTGIGTPAGAVQFYAVAGDSLGNQSQSYTGSEDFMCGGYEM